MVARTVRVGEVPGSNPGAPIERLLAAGGRRGRFAPDGRACRMDVFNEDEAAEVALHAE